MNTSINDSSEKRREITRDEAFEILKAMAQGLFAAYYAALEKFNAEVLQTATPSARRKLEPSLLHAKMVDAFAAAMPDNWEVGKYGRFIIRYDGVQIIIKKLSGENKPAYVPTILSGKILSQVQTDLFPGDVSAKAEPVLIFGYTRDRLGQYVDPRIVYYNDGPRWIIGMEDFMQRTTVAQSGRTEKIVVRPKEKAAQQAG